MDSDKKKNLIDYLNVLEHPSWVQISNLPEQQDDFKKLKQAN